MNLNPQEFAAWFKDVKNRLLADRKLTKDYELVKILKVSAGTISNALHHGQISPKLLKNLEEHLTDSERDSMRQFKDGVNDTATTRQLRPRQARIRRITSKATSPDEDDSELPLYATVRREEKDQVIGRIERLNYRLNDPSERQILAIRAPDGEGRSYFVSAMARALKSHYRGKDKPPIEVYSIPLKPYWLRKRALCDDSAQESAVSGELLADSILFYLHQPLPRSHSGESKISSISALKQFFENKREESRREDECMILILQDAWPDEEPADNSLAKLVQDAVVDLVDEIRQIVGLRVVISVPFVTSERLQNYIQPFALGHLTAPSVRLLSAQMLTVPARTIGAPGNSIEENGPRIDEDLSAFLSEAKDQPIRLTADEWALALGTLSTLQALQNSDFSKIDFFNGLKGAIQEQARISRHAKPMTESKESAVKRFLLKNQALNHRQLVVLFAASLFAVSFSVGSVQRVLRDTDFRGIELDFRVGLPEQGTVSSDVPEAGLNKATAHWYLERGAVREVLNALRKCGWLDLDVVPSKTSFNLRFRPSLNSFVGAIVRGHDLVNLASNDELVLLWKRLKLGYCRALINDDEAERGSFFMEHTESLSRQRTALFMAARYANTYQESEYLYYIAMRVARFFSARGNWHVADDWLTSAIEVLKSKHNFHDKADVWIFRLQAFQVSCNFYRDFFATPAYRDLERRVENQGIGNVNAAEIGHWYLLLARRANVEVSPTLSSGADTSNKAIQLCRASQDYFASAIIEAKHKRLQEFTNYHTSKIASLTEENGADVAWRRHVQENGEAVEISKSRAEAVYWEARSSAQLRPQWRENEREANTLVELFRRAITACEEADAYRPLVMSHVWIARIFLFGPYGHIIDDGYTAIEHADFELIRAQSFASQSSDTKERNVLQFHRAVVSLRKHDSDKGMLVKFRDTYSDTISQYDEMGEKLWASWTRLIFANEFEKAAIKCVNPPDGWKEWSALALREAVSDWGTIILDNKEVSGNDALTIAPPPLFIDIMQEVSELLTKGDSDAVVDVTEAKDKILEWAALRGMETNARRPNEAVTQ